MVQEAVQPSLLTQTQSLSTGGSGFRVPEGLVSVGPRSSSHFSNSVHSDWSFLEYSINPAGTPTLTFSLRKSTWK